jgi:aminoglycoside phosphotransferase family enzyme
VDAKLQALRSPSSYPEEASSVEVIETHFAWVFLVGQHAYKMKKPIGYPQLDLHSLEARKNNCEEELRLNRRLAPDVYRGLVPLVRADDGKLHVGGKGTPVDWLIWMRRLSSHLMLDRAIAAGTASTTALAQVGVLLARFYRQQSRVLYSPSEYIARLGQQIQADRSALLAPELRLEAAQVCAAAAAMNGLLAPLNAELSQRALEQRIVDAHGDLRPEHICLCEPPCIIDSLEFSEDLRALDSAEELAFLLVECEVAGDADAGMLVVSAYRHESHDPFSERLLNFYRSRRAMVRAKIIAWHLCDPTVMNIAPWREQAQMYVGLAEQYARRAQYETRPYEDQ